MRLHDDLFRDELDAWRRATWDSGDLYASKPKPMNYDPRIVSQEQMQTLVVVLLELAADKDHDAPVRLEAARQLVLLAKQP